jgi:hypothetical protein
MKNQLNTINSMNFFSYYYKAQLVKKFQMTKSTENIYEMNSIENLLIFNVTLMLFFYFLENLI